MKNGGAGRVQERALIENMWTSNSTCSICLIKVFVQTFAGGKLVRVVNVVRTVDIFWRNLDFSLQEATSEANCTCVCVLATIPLPSSMAGGGSVPCHSHVQTNPRLIPQHNVLSKDITAATTHNSGQTFGLLKDVMLSELAFKAWSMHRLSRPLRNEAQLHKATHVT